MRWWLTWSVRNMSILSTVTINANTKREDIPFIQTRVSFLEAIISFICYSFIEFFHCRESVCKWWVAVQGLNHNEVRTISEKVGEQPEYNNEREKRVEWSVPTWTVLNGLEVMGYKVVTCGDYMTGEQRHDQKEFVWTLYKNKEEWENSTKWNGKSGGIEKWRPRKTDYKWTLMYKPLCIAAAVMDTFYYGYYYLLTVKSRFMFMIINSRLEVNWNLQNTKYSFNFSWEMISVLSESQNFYFPFALYKVRGNCCGYFTKNKISNFNFLIDLKSLPTLSINPSYPFILKQF